MTVPEFQNDHVITEQKLMEAGRLAVEQDGAESLVLGCTLEFGFFEKMQKELNVPVIDPSMAALKQAEQAAILKKHYNWKPSRKWSCEPPSEDDIKQFGLFVADYEFGNRVIVK
jgi:allantoin racemase